MVLLMNTLQISISSHGNPSSQRRGLWPPNGCFSPQRRKKMPFMFRDGFTINCSADRLPFLRIGITERTVWTMREKRESVVVVRGFGFNGGGGGGGWDKSSNTRVLGNLALAIGLTHLTVTGQLGWILDAVVSIWLLAVLLPIVGLGAFFWFAGRDVVQSSCPNCGKDFQIFKSFLKDGEQLCPYCSQPFAVQGDNFVKGSAGFSSDRFTTSGPIFGGSSPRSGKQKVSSATVVDVEAEVRDVD